jgi:hypothetical protein
VSDQIRKRVKPVVEVLMMNQSIDGGCDDSVRNLLLRSGRGLSFARAVGSVGVIL